MADVKWIKIVTDIFDDEKILMIEQLPDADTIIVLWFKLLCLSGKQNNRGVFLIRDSMPYTDEMFAAVFRRPINTVRLAMKTFSDFGMVEIINGVVAIPNWAKHQNIEGMERRQEYMKTYMRNYREQQKELASGKRLHKRLCKQNVSDADIDKDTDKDTEKNISIAAKQKHKHGEYQNVLLTDDEFDKLKTEFSDWKERIERLSEYIASKGVTYKNHLATIRSWAKKDDKAPGGKRVGFQAYDQGSPTEYQGIDLMAEARDGT